MKDEILYMTGVVAVGFLVNYALRALPFLLFAGKGRELPRSVERLGAFISPVIIAGLIFYSYSGLAWQTAWPYVAGAITVALHLWKRNPLASIVAGTAVYMCLMATGCASRPPIALDSQAPSVSISSLGLKIGDRLVSPQEVVETLEDNGIPRTRVVHILLEPDVRDMRPARQFMAYLAASGYTRPVLVTRRHSEAYAVEHKDVSARPGRVVSRPQRVRYKPANE